DEQGNSHGGTPVMVTGISVSVQPEGGRGWRSERRTASAAPLCSPLESSHPLAFIVPQAAAREARPLCPMGAARRASPYPVSSLPHAAARSVPGSGKGCEVRMPLRGVRFWQKNRERGGVRQGRKSARGFRPWLLTPAPSGRKAGTRLPFVFR